MNILGITHPISLNPAACLISDGKLVAFAEEERFSRIKHAPHNHPVQAIKFCLDRAELQPAEVDITAIGFESPGNKQLRSVKLPEYLLDQLSLAERFEHRTAIALFHYDTLIEHHGDKQYFDHHLCHAASAAIPAGFDSANIITLDGWGGSASGFLGFFDQEQGIRKCADIDSFNSWGMLYELITDILGFQFHSGEGKTMGLASYGQVDQDLLPDFTDSALGLPDVKKYDDWVSRKITRRLPGEPLNSIHCNLAATLQHYYEKSLVRMARWLQDQSGYGRFVLAGGVALNCTGNGRLAEETFVDDLFIQPASHDAGTALGAAILAHHNAIGSWPDVPFSHAYWGPDFSNSQIKAALDFSGVPYTHCDPVEVASEALARNEVVGWFQGASETGPRALGNRSILANPGDADNLRRVNDEIKRRETWRPLAPSVLAERYHDIFDARLVSRHMLLAVNVKPCWRDRLPAIVHTDGSARPQAVYAKDNAIYHRLISRFEQITGLPALLNTSFNLNDEPMVNSPENALATFFRSGIQTLVLGEYLIRKG